MCNGGFMLEHSFKTYNCFHIRGSTNQQVGCIVRWGAVQQTEVPVFEVVVSQTKKYHVMSTLDANVLIVSPRISNPFLGTTVLGMFSFVSSTQVQFGYLLVVTPHTAVIHLSTTVLPLHICGSEHLLAKCFRRM